jgi:hypothetical protein
MKRQTMAVAQNAQGHPATVRNVLRLETRGDLQANSAMIDETIAPVRKPEGPHAANIESTTALLSPTG